MVGLEVIVPVATTVAGLAAIVELVLKLKRTERRETRELQSYEQRVTDLETVLQRVSTAPTGPSIDPVALYQAIDRLPSKVLATIQGSINPHQGKVAELLAYAQLRSDYDVIIPLGKPVDFVGVSTDHIDFIEVKSGQAQLTPSERSIKKLVDEGKVDFRIIRVTDDSAKVVAGLAADEVPV